MTDSPFFSPNTLNDLANNFQQYIVSPLNAFGLGGFPFDIQGDETVNLTADITDHYTESNDTIQDHIAIRPKKITLKSYVGELKYTVDPDGNTPTQALGQKLTEISSYLPALAAGEQQAVSLIGGVSANGVVSNFNSITNNAANIYALVQNTITPQTRQQQAYAFFKALMQTKTLVSVQTPFEFMSMMAIESVVGFQPEDSISVTHFTVTLKEIRIASTQVEATTTNGGPAPAATGATQQQAQQATTNATSGVDPSVLGAAGTLPVNTGVNITPGIVPQIGTINDVKDNKGFLDTFNHITE